MKKKADAVKLLDDLRNQDPKKRFISVQSLKDIAIALGPLKTRTQFLQFLNEFIDDQQYIVIQLLNQLQNFSQLLGGQQHQKTLLPLLISFCKTDQKKQAQKATQIIQKILKKNKDLIVDTIKKLAKTQMNTSRQAAIRLISHLISLVPQNQVQLLEIYSGMVFSDVPSFKIIGTKYITKLLQSVKNKQQVGKLLEVIYNDSEDLPKILALQALVNYYAVNSNLTFAKFKALFIVNSWRLNIKICEVIPLAAKVFSKAHFKATFQSSLLKLLSSNQPELRSKACLVLKHVASTMTQQDIKSKLIPIVKKLVTDPIDYVKIQMSENIVRLIQVCSQGIINEEILPIIFSFIKTNQLAVGIIKNFQVLTKKLSNEMIQQKILTPLISQFNTDNWRTKCQLIELLGNVVNSPIFLNEKMPNLLVGLLSDRISAVREKACSLIINIILQQPAQWSDNMLISKLSVLKENPNYILRQIIVQIIDKTCDKVSDKTLNDVYKSILNSSLNDKVPNVKARALKALKQNKRLFDKIIEKNVQKLKSDIDIEVRQLAGIILAA